MANPKIKVKRSSVEGKVPAVTQLERGELAVNSYDGKIYILKDQFSVGIATTTHTVNPWNEPNGVGAGISYSGDIKVRSTVTDDLEVSGITTVAFVDATQLKVSGVTTMTGMLRIDSGNLQVYGTAPNIFLRDTNDNPDYRFMNSHGSIKIFDETNGVDRFIINPSGKVSILKDLDVDGHTFLDNVNISGVSTFSSNVKFDGSIGVGIANPSQKIHIDGGNLTITNSTQSGSSAPQIRLNSSSSDGSSTRFMLGLATGDNHFINGAASNDTCISSPSNMLFGVGSTRKFRIKTTDVLTDVDLIPSGDNQTSLGRSNARWSDLYTVNATFTGNADFDDDVKIRMGDSQDLLIFHQESNGNSIIREQGGGVLSLQTNGAYMNVYDSTNQQTMAQFTNGGACQFRHNGTIRLQTTSSGAEVVGTLNVTGVSTSLTHHSTGGTYRGTQDTKSDAGFVMDLDKKLYVDYNGYLRNIIGHESADNSIQIGQHNTGLIDDIVLKPGTSGQVILHHGSNSSNIKLSTLTTGVNVNGTTVTDGLTVGNYDFPTVAGSEGLVLKVASDGNLEFGSGASGGVVPTEKTFTASQGQTVFTDTTDLPTYIQVFVNGIKIRPTSDFSKSGASVTLVTAATAGDEIDLVRFD